MKILIVEDDPASIETFRLAFEFRWPDADLICTSKGAKLTQFVEKESPDIVILDLGLPDVDGLAVLREVRNFSDVPIIIVTARSEQMSIVKGLEFGADDYVTKPFDPIVLVSRIKSVLRRSQVPDKKIHDKGSVKCGSSIIDFASRQVTHDGKPIKLTSMEWNVLYNLARNSDNVVTYQTLMDKIWGTNHILEDIAALRTCVWRLRKKLGDDVHSPTMIISERGVGYRFILPK